MKFYAQDQGTLFDELEKVLYVKDKNSRRLRLADTMPYAAIERVYSKSLNDRYDGGGNTGAYSTDLAFSPSGRLPRKCRQTASASLSSTVDMAYDHSGKRRLKLSGHNERFAFTGKERDEETGFGYFGARYMDHELTTMWLSVDPMSDKYPSLSPYAYCAWNPVKLVDPDGMELTDFRAADGTLIMRINDGSDAVFVLCNTGWNERDNKITKKTGNAYFKYESGSAENINIKTVIDRAQEFVKDQYTNDGSQTYCNFATCIIVESFMSACTAKGFTIDGDASLFHNSARSIYSQMKPNALYDDAIRLARTIDDNHAYLAIGSINGHVVTFTTENSGKENILNIGGSRGNTYQDGSWLNAGKQNPKYYTIGAFKK